MAIDGSDGLGFSSPKLDAWLRERADLRLQAMIDDCFRRAEGERAAQRYRAVANARLTTVVNRQPTTAK